MNEQRPNGFSAYARDWWARTAVGLGGLFVGMTLAWFTALQNKGISRNEMEKYVIENSPYIKEKPLLDERNHLQDERLLKLETAKPNDILTRSDMFHWSIELQRLNKDLKGFTVPEPKHQE